MHAAEDAKPGTTAWDDGECIVIGGKGSVLQLDGVRVYRDMFDRILPGRERDKAPDTTELLASAASLGGSAVAVFGGSRPQALSIKASESFSVMHEIYFSGEAKRQETLDAYDRKGAISGANAQSETSQVKRALHDIGLMDAKRMRDKSVDRLMHLLFGKKLDKAADLIAVYPELMFARLIPIPTHNAAPTDMPNADAVLPLHVACSIGFLEGVRKLLGKGASLQAADKQGWTALHLASMMGHEELASLLLKAGADPRRRTGSAEGLPSGVRNAISC